MDDFKRLDTNHYVCYTVRSELWNAEQQRYIEKKLVILDNEDDAKKCLAIMDAYARMCRGDLLMRNKMTKDMFAYDGATLHLLSGIKVEYEEYCQTLQRIRDIERTYSCESWGCMDEYANLFRYKARRPRSFWSAALCCASCCCCCFGYSTYTL